MANRDDLIWKQEAAFAGWGCKKCGWLLSNPRFANTKPWPQDVLEAFDAHVCAEHPKPKKPREDVNQAAARVVREATERV
jgi:hypothetical protein